jgi:hypothetical protein
MERRCNPETDADISCNHADDDDWHNPVYMACLDATNIRERHSEPRFVCRHVGTYVRGLRWSTATGDACQGVPHKNWLMQHYAAAIRATHPDLSGRLFRKEFRDRSSFSSPPGAAGEIQEQYQQSSDAMKPGVPHSPPPSLAAQRFPNPPTLSYHLPPPSQRYKQAGEEGVGFA